MKFNGIEDIKRYNAETGHYFFSADTMRFFRSRVSGETFGANGELFITSDKNEGPGYSFPRRYTVRAIRDDGSVDTMSEFQQFTTLAQARAFAKKLTVNA